MVRNRRAKAEDTEKVTEIRLPLAYHMGNASLRAGILISRVATPTLLAVTKVFRREDGNLNLNATDCYSSSALRNSTITKRTTIFDL